MLYFIFVIAWVYIQVWLVSGHKVISKALVSTHVWGCTIAYFLREFWKNKTRKVPRCWKERRIRIFELDMRNIFQIMKHTEMIVSDIYIKSTKKWYASCRNEEADKLSNLVDLLHFLLPALKIFYKFWTVLF